MVHGFSDKGIATSRMILFKVSLCLASMKLAIYNYDADLYPIF
jgi:hypothetical protein